ncbi:MAG: site-specific integrase [Oscillospiraceae bacterium]|nr:site-specific integrase [Oscillospiraceae bacterium]
MGYWHDKDDKRHAIYDRDPAKLYAKIQEKQNEAPPVLTFEAAADAWERKHWDRIGSKTAETYAAPLRRIRQQFAGMTAEEVSAQDIQAFLADLGKEGFSRRSVQMHRDIINMIYNDAILERGLRFNPCVAVSVPRNLPTKKRELPKDDAIEAVKAGESAPFGLFALVCLYTGLRRGEALALRFEDIDRKSGVIHVTKAVEFVGNNPHIKPPKTAAGVRDVPLLDPLAAVLPEKKTGLLFPREDGGALTKTQYRKRWLKYCVAIGYDITAHQLRHGYATILYEAGIADKDAQELLGHASISVTRDVYTHIRSTRRTETAQKLNSFVVNSVVNNS